MSFTVFVFIMLNGGMLDFGKYDFYLDRGVTVVPLRMFMEKAGATVSYDSAKSETQVKYKGKTLVFPLYSGSVTVNGITQKLEKSMVQGNGAHYVPLRFLVEQMNGSLSYDASTHTATVITPKEGD